MCGCALSSHEEADRPSLAGSTDEDAYRFESFSTNRRAYKLAKPSVGSAGCKGNQREELRAA